MTVFNLIKLILFSPKQADRLTNLLLLKLEYGLQEYLTFDDSV